MHPHDFDSAEDYADACLQDIDPEQRAALLEAQISESDWRNYFIDEFYAMVDAESGEMERENAEIEARLMRDRGMKFS